MSIQLSISEVCEEIRYLKDAASDLLAPSAVGVLAEFERVLQAIVWDEPGKVTAWELRPDNPLTTIISEGEFCHGGKVGAHHCFAEISSIWGITPVRPPRKQRTAYFKVVDIASVHIQIFEAASKERTRALGSWRMELGAPDAPGCFFHTQILAEKGRTESPFPHSLDIPRLPGFLFTPMAVTEFVLAELFQEKWRDPTRQVRHEIKSWARIQRDRLLRTFLWHIRRILEASGSPWMHLKSGIPDADWFVRNDLDLRAPDSFLKR